MSIGWPSPSYTGEIYTDPSNNKWRWNGYAWDNLILKYSGGYENPWVIYDKQDRIRSYPNFLSALAAANRGDVIKLLGNTSETINEEVTLKDGVDINLNGNVFEIIAGDIFLFKIESSITKSFPKWELRGIDNRVPSKNRTKIKFNNGRVNLTFSTANTNTRNLFLINPTTPFDVDFTDLVCILRPSSPTNQRVIGLAIATGPQGFVGDFLVEGEVGSVLNGGYFYCINGRFGSDAVRISDGNGNLPIELNNEYNLKDYPSLTVSNVFGWSDNGNGIRYVGQAVLYE